MGGKRKPPAKATGSLPPDRAMGVQAGPTGGYLQKPVLGKKGKGKPKGKGSGKQAGG